MHAFLQGGCNIIKEVHNTIGDKRQFANLLDHIDQLEAMNVSHVLKFMTHDFGDALLIVWAKNTFTLGSNQNGPNSDHLYDTLALSYSSRITEHAILQLRIK